MSMSLLRYNTITAVGTFTSINGSGDSLILDPSACSGGADAETRTDVEDAPGADGALVLAVLDGQQIVTLSGKVNITSDPTYFSGADTLIGNLKTALNAMKSAAANLTHSGGTNTPCRKYGKLDVQYQSGILVCTFSLIVDA